MLETIAILGIILFLVIVAWSALYFLGLMADYKIRNDEGMTAEQHERSAEVWGEYHTGGRE